VEKKMETVVRVLVQATTEARMNTEEVERTARLVLELEHVAPEASLTVVLTDDKEIQALNRQFRGIDAPTDVLAFAEEEAGQVFVDGSDDPPYLGDVIVSLPQARVQAAEHGHSTAQELRLLVAHGVLHLLGYDHAAPADEAAMWARQEEILRRVGEWHAEEPEVPHQANLGARRTTLGRSFVCAFAGLWHAVRTQRNMRIHLSVAVAVLLLGLYLQLTWTEWALLALTIGFVLVAEMFNTVAEAALDAAAPSFHPLVKTAKDVAAGAVLLTALISLVVGLLILGPPLWAKIGLLLGH
jgi:probable rRNA maturation factor